MSRPDHTRASVRAARQRTTVCDCGAVIHHHARWARVLIAAAAAAAVIGIGITTVDNPVSPSDVAADSVLSAPEQDYFNRVNLLRVSRGLNALILDDNLVDLARSQTHDMVTSQHLYHTPDLAAGVTTTWEKLGENVGFGSNTAFTWAAFMNSPSHLENLLDPAFERFGIGVEADPNGIEWTTHRFMQVRKPPIPLPTMPPPTPAPPTTSPPQPTPTPRVTTTQTAPAPTKPTTTVTTVEPETTMSTTSTSEPDAGPGDGTSKPTGTAASSPTGPARPGNATPESFSANTSVVTSADNDVAMRWWRSTLAVVLLLVVALLSDGFVRRHPQFFAARHQHLPGGGTPSHLA